MPPPPCGCAHVQGPTYEELIDNQANLTSCIDDTLPPAVCAMLGEILCVDAAQLHAKHPQAMEAIMGELCDQSLYSDAVIDDVIVYAPVTAIVGVVTKPIAPAADGSTETDATKPAATGATEEGGVAPLFPKYKHKIIASGFALDRWNGSTEPKREEVELPPVGQAMGRVGGGAADRAEDSVIRVESAIEDAWYPHSSSGAFFNVGLKNWQHVRNEWNDLGAKNAR